MKKSNTILDDRNVGAIINRPNGITLIALVITIIVLIILAGVAINLTLGENGIFKRAETAKLKYEIAQAEEELDIKIAELQVNKQGSATLQDVVDMLKAEEDMDYIVSLEEIASITGVETIGDVDEIYVVYKIYQFRVDDRLQTEFISIVESYTADVAISSTLKSHDGKNEDEKYLATMEIKVESEGQVQSIEIETVDGKITETPTSLPYTKEIQVEIGQKYIVKVTTPDGKYKRYIVEEKAEDTIKTAAELAAFRDKVNSGLTYEGKTVTLANDINLSTVCGENVNGQEISWEPIGTSSITFAGTFDGNNKQISNIYINATTDYVALFRANTGTIKHLVADGKIISSGTFVGGVVAHNNGMLINCNNKAYVQGYNVVSGVVALTTENSIIEKCTNTNEIYATYGNAGGIEGNGGGTIKQCYNTGYVHSTTITAGGISGYHTNGSIYNCYNIGNISSSSTIGGICGAAGNSGQACVYAYNCYNIGTITGSTWNGSIIGLNNANGGTSSAVNCYTTNVTVDTLNAGSYSDNVWTADVQDDKGNYLNAGYPILKWQMGE